LDRLLARNPAYRNAPEILVFYNAVFNVTIGLLWK